MNATTAPSSQRRAARRFGRVVGVLTAAAASIGILAGLASPASAFVEAGSAWAQETVTCNSVNHTVTVDFQTVGLPSGIIGGSDLFPYELQSQVYVKISEYVGGRWVTMNTWQPVLGNRRIVVPSRGTTYWYFHFAFKTAQNSFVYRNEWAGGGGTHGLYSNQNGYRALNRCYS
jgi:hypothetical protein